MDNLWKNRDWSVMLLKEIDKPFNSKDYIFELKFDGIRAIIFANKKEVKIQSRNKQDLTPLFPELQEIKKLVTKNTIFDGEIVLFENKKPSFSRLQKRMHLKDHHKIEKLAKDDPVTFVAFDILYENKNLTTHILTERKKILNTYAENDVFVKTKSIEENGINLFKSVQKLGLEGIVAKAKNGIYHINKRTDDFIKIKNIQRDTFLIGGYEEKKNNILSLAIGEYRNQKFYFVGKVSIHPKAHLYEEIKNQKETKNYFCNFEEKIHYIKPSLSCHVEYLERTKENHLRHPIFKDID